MITLKSSQVVSMNTVPLSEEHGDALTVTMFKEVVITKAGIEIQRLKIVVYDMISEETSTYLNYI